MTDTINSISKIFLSDLQREILTENLISGQFIRHPLKQIKKKKKSTVFGRITIFNLYKTFAIFTNIITIYCVRTGTTACGLWCLDKH